MKVCLPVRTLLMGVLLLPALTNGQIVSSCHTSYQLGTEGNSFSSNVPLNQIKIKAFRYLHLQFPTLSGESWFKSPEGLTASFSETNLLYKAFFNKRGSFLYSLKYYPGQDLSEDLRKPIQKLYPGYDIGLVTEVNNGEKVFYAVRIENSSYLKTLTFCEGKMEVSEELINGRPGPVTGNLAAQFNY